MESADETLHARHARVIGPRIGPRIGPKVGPAVGVSADEIGSAVSMAGVTRDATSGIYVPASAAEWTTTLQVAGIATGGPSFLWLCQEASGNLAETIAGAVTLAPTGAPSYQQAVSGWSRKAVALADASSTNFISSSASLPNIATTSFLLMAWAAVTGTPGGLRFLLPTGSTQAALQVTSGLLPRMICNGNVAVGAHVLTAGSVVPWVLKIDRTNSVCAGYVLADKLQPAFDASITGQTMSFGVHTPSSNSPPLAVPYGCGFVGAAAELSDAQIKKLLQTLGWTPTWS